MEKATELIVEKMGQKFEAGGLPRIAGRILGYLLVCREAQSLDALTDALRISKASVSANARLLERMRVVERVTHPGDRRDYYTIVDDLPMRVLEMSLDQLRRTRDLLDVALLAPQAEDVVVRERLETFAAFFGDMLDAFAGAGARWEERNHPEGSARPAAEAWR